MRFRFIPMFACACLAMTLPAYASETSTEKKAEAEGEKMVCKGERSLEFGSHRRAKKVCKTEAEWKLLEKGTQRELQAFRERAQTHGDNRGRN